MRNRDLRFQGNYAWRVSWRVSVWSKTTGTLIFVFKRIHRLTKLKIQTLDVRFQGIYTWRISVWSKLRKLTCSCSKGFIDKTIHKLTKIRDFHFSGQLYIYIYIYGAFRCGPQNETLHIRLQKDSSIKQSQQFKHLVFVFQGSYSWRVSVGPKHDKLHIRFQVDSSRCFQRDENTVLYF